MRVLAVIYQLFSVYYWVFLFQLLKYFLLITLVIGSGDHDADDRVEKKKITSVSDRKVISFFFFFPGMSI